MGFFSGRQAGLSPTSRPTFASSARVSSFRNSSQMSTNLADYESLNQDVKNWADEMKGTLKSSAPKTTGTLARSIGRRVYKKDGIVQRVGFALKRYGVFVEKGVGRGRRAGSNSVKPSPWFNPAMDTGINELGDIAQTHYADITVRNIRIG